MASFMLLKCSHARTLIDTFRFSTKENGISIKCDTNLINPSFVACSNARCQQCARGYFGINGFLNVR